MKKRKEDMKKPYHYQAPNTKSNDYIFDVAQILAVEITPYSFALYLKNGAVIDVQNSIPDDLFEMIMNTKKRRCPGDPKP